MSLIDDIMDLPMGGKILLAGAVGTVGVIAYVNRGKGNNPMLPADAAASTNQTHGLLSFLPAGTFSFGGGGGGGGGGASSVSGGPIPPGPSRGGGGISTGAFPGGGGVFGGSSGRPLRRLPPTPSSGGTMAHATRMFGR